MEVVHPRRIGLSARALTALVLVAASSATAEAQLGAGELAQLELRAVDEGWTFDVAPNPATERDFDVLCGFVPPADPPPDAPFGARPTLRGPLPAAFDWRDYGGCTPVRDQATCGSCWAFATVGALECNILIQDGDSVDLSEQWLVSCNHNGWGCDGGYFAHAYHLDETDSCNDSGAVLEADLPYTATNGSCNCPYAHSYLIDGWAYIAGSSSIPSVDAIKQAILDYGPVSAAVCVDSAFQAYSSGVFNSSASGQVNHAIVLVGWDDNGGNGYWILRNSWGAGWGESGYMRIAYGCSSVGYGACYVEYTGVDAPEIQVTPADPDFGNVSVGDTPTLQLTVKNVGVDPLTGTVSGAAGPFSIVGDTSYSLNSGETKNITVQFAPDYVGTFATTLDFTGGGGTFVVVTGTAVGIGIPADECAYALLITDGTHTGNTAAASTSGTASCGGGGNADVWWKYTADFSGTVTIDTVGSDFDTILTAFDTCGGSELACNDDADGGPTSAISFGLLENESCYIRVAGVAGQTGNVTLNISNAATPLSFSGEVIDEFGDGVVGVTLSGLPGSPTTNSQGDFSAIVDFGFTGTVTPQRTGWVFEPGQRSYSGLMADKTGVWFVAHPSSLTIAGRVVDGTGMGLPGVRLVGFPSTVTTDAQGYYSGTVDYGFDGTIVPQMAGYAFSPFSRPYANLAQNVVDQDFVATRQVGALQVVLSPDSAAADGRWRVDGGPWRFSGETAIGLTAGMHTIEYSDVAGFTAPPHEIRSVWAGQTSVVTSSYVADGCMLTVNVQPPDAATVVTDPVAAVGGRYASNALVTLTVLPQDGYAVQEWYGVDALDDAGVVATVLMTDDRSVTVVLAGTLGAHDELSPMGDALPVPAMPCGGGLVSMLPLMLAGAAGMKSRRFGG